MPPEAITVALGVARVSTLNPFKYGMLIIEALSGTGKIDFFSAVRAKLEYAIPFQTKGTVKPRRRGE